MTQIFRTIQVGHGQHLTLAEPIPADVLPLMERLGPDRLRMRPGTYHGAESITAVLASDENVQRLEFAYAAGTVYQSLFDDFVSELGEPTRQNGGSGSRRSVWEDPQTRFQLFEKGGKSGAEVGSELVDRAGGEG